jgi:hypothetical protein
MERFKELDIKSRVKNIIPKIERAGLVDISVGWDDIDWPPRDIGSILKMLAPKSDLFMVGRTFMAWSRHAKGFAKEIAEKSIRCKMIIANPKLELKSLVIDDQAHGELQMVYKTFVKELPKGFQEAKNAKYSKGFIEIYGIPAYIPEAFSVLKLNDGREYCNLEIGIAVDPSERVPIFFKHISKNDVYSSLKHIYENILTHDANQEVAKLLLRVDAKKELGHPPDNKPIRFFVSYAREDSILKEKLLHSLKQQLATVKGYQFEIWDDDKIEVGDAWSDQIKTAIKRCKFGLLLISPAFLTSKYINQTELPAFVGRDLSNPRGKRAIPAILNPILFGDDIDLKGLEKKQIFFYKTKNSSKSFQECHGKSEQTQYVIQLVQQIIKIVKRYGPI